MRTKYNTIIWNMIDIIFLIPMTILIVIKLTIKVIAKLVKVIQVVVQDVCGFTLALRESLVKVLSVKC